MDERPFSWEGDPSPDGDGTAIFARYFNSDGTPKGDAFRVNDSTEHDQRNSTLVVLSDDTLACVYRSGRGLVTSPGAFGENGFVAMKRYDKEGTQLLAETIVRDNEIIGAIRLRIEPDEPRAAALENGRLAVTWIIDRLHRDDPGRIGPPYPKVIEGRVFNANGTPHTDTFEVSQPPLDIFTNELYPEIAAAPGGGFAIAWQSLRDGTEAVRVRHYDPNGLPRGNEQAILP